MKYQRRSEHWKRHFKHNEGRVNLEIWGHRIGWQKRAINVFRWKPSTRDPSGFDKIDWFEERDLVHLEKCIKQARNWFKAGGASTE